MLLRAANRLYTVHPMDMSALLLARTQFVASLSFFVVFLALAWALAGFALVFKLRAGGGARPEWLDAYRFWVRIFALAWVLALASSVPVVFLLGMLWPTLMTRIGNVLGPPLAYAVVTLFVCKSCFLGVMLYGQQRVSSRLHTLSVAMVALGLTLFVAFLVVIESWLHVPQGAVLIDGRYLAQDWWAIFFNAAMPWHLLLFMIGGLLAAAFLVLGVTAWQALRRALDAGEQAAFRAARSVAALAFLLLLPAGAGMLMMVAEHQPMLGATVAAHWRSGTPADLVLWAWPDATLRSNLSAFALPLPGTGWLGVGTGQATLGLDHYAGMHPPVALVFWLARLGWFVGGLMLLATLLCWRKAIPMQLGAWAGAPSRWYLRLLSALSVAGVLVLLAGWLVLELGRQPYAVDGTVTWLESLAVNPSVVWLAVGAAGQLLLYGALVYVFVRMVLHGARYGVVPVRKGFKTGGAA